MPRFLYRGDAYRNEPQLRHVYSFGSRGYLRTTISNPGSVEPVRDMEGLVLPMDTSDGVPGELTTMLDDGCITGFQRCRRTAS